VKIISQRSKEGLNRREFLWRAGGGLGGIALAQMLGEENLLAEASAIKPPHFAPKGPETKGRKLP